MKFKSRHILITVLAILIIWVVSAVLIVVLIPDWSNRGTFGDMFGVSNALFSGLALAGIIYAIILQRHELQLQRHELKLTRKELHSTAESQKRGHILEQTQFLLNLSGSFLENEQKYQQAWNLLSHYGKTPKEMKEKEWRNSLEPRVADIFIKYNRDYKEIPRKMKEKEWNNKVHALRKCYESTVFLYRIARLASKGIIQYETLYLLYNEKIIDYVDSKFEILRVWCGTGLDLAANYSIGTLINMVTPIKELIKMMHQYQQVQVDERDLDISSFILGNLEKIEIKLKEDPDRFDVTSDKYIDNGIDIIND